MNLDSKPGFVRSVQGQLLRHSERREVAIFLWKGTLWVADFIDGEGVLVDAATWFRFNCGALSSPHARRRMVLESAIPLSADLVARIGCLPRPGTKQKSTGLNLLLAALAARLPRSRLAMKIANRFDRWRTHRFDSAAR